MRIVRSGQILFATYVVVWIKLTNKERKQCDRGHTLLQKCSSAIYVVTSSFYDGEISRGYEKVQRIYVASYEDENKILHEAHNLYVVVKPAKWTFHNTLHGKGGE